MVNSPAAAQTRAEFDRARQRMVDEAIVAAGVKHPRVIQAMRDTPRHEFVEPARRDGRHTSTCPCPSANARRSRPPSSSPT
jgi:protein-L-isoaspartate O-methyltransferase